MAKPSSFNWAKHIDRHAPYRREVRKPVAGTVRVAVDGTEIAEEGAWTCDATEGRITFTEPPAEGTTITAGFEFDVPVRFDTDRLEINLSTFQAGEMPSIPLTEIRL